MRLHGDQECGPRALHLHQAIPGLIHLDLDASGAAGPTTLGQPNILLDNGPDFGLKAIECRPRVVRLLNASNQEVVLHGGNVLIDVHRFVHAGHKG